MREMGLEGAKAAPTAGTREEQKAASVPAVAPRVEVEDESSSALETQGPTAESRHIVITLFKKL